MSFFTLPNYPKPETFSSFREIHFDGLQRTVSKFKDYESLKEWVLKSGKVLNSCKIEDLFKKNEGKKKSFIVDKISAAIFPKGSNDIPENLTPVQCDGDGNCLYNACSMLLVGNKNANKELRLRVIEELIVNRIRYETFQFSKSAAFEDYERDIFETSKDGAYSSLRCIAALCNVLGCEIFSIYPDFQSFGVNRQDMHRLFSPVVKKHSEILYVMWTHTNNSNLEKGWTPNHFCPCLQRSECQIDNNSLKTETQSKQKQRDCPSQSNKSIHSFFKPRPKKKIDIDLKVPEKSDNHIPLPKKMKLDETENKSTNGKGEKGSSSYSTKFSSEWTKTWPCIQPSKGDVHSFFCTVCTTKVSCAHQGILDIKRHMSSKKHSQFTKQLDRQSKLPKPDLTMLRKVTNAEVKVAMAIVKHNVPFQLADSLSPILKTSFDDSRIAKSYGAARMKTTCIVNKALKPYYRSKIVESMKSEPFALCTDGSSDQGLLKMNPLLVRIFDNSKGKVVNNLLDMCTTKKSDAETLFSAIDNVIVKEQISWRNCVGIGVDNTSVNVGRHNSIKTRVLDKNESVYVNGCPCHIVHNTACKSAEEFSKATGFDVEDFLVDIFYWFDKSSKRKVLLEEFCQLWDQGYKNVVKYVSTRWLSLEAAVTRCLKLYDALRSYFMSEEDSTARFVRLREAFTHPITEVYLYFYQYILQTFIRFNLFLQRSDPLISRLHGQIQRFLKDIACKFVRIDVIKKANKIEKLDYVRKKQKQDDELEIGIWTKQLIRRLQNEGEIGRRELEKFYNGVRVFNEKAFGYAISNLPVSDPLLFNAQAINFNTRSTEATLHKLEYFITRYPSLLPYQDPKILDDLTGELHDFQLLEDSEIPSEIWEKSETTQKDTKLDVLWSFIGSMQAGDGQLRFEKLFRIARLVLTIPHSNAEEERIFSIIRKNKTCFRPTLDPNETLASIITVKLGMDGEDVHRINLDDKVLEDAKKATWAYNQEHQ